MARIAGITIEKDIRGNARYARIDLKKYGNLLNPFFKEVGIEVDFENQKAGDLAFFINKSGKVTHVGILDGNKSILHASGLVRFDGITPEGIIHAQTKQLTHDLCCIKRILDTK